MVLRKIEIELSLSDLVIKHYVHCICLQKMGYYKISHGCNIKYTI